MNKNIKKNYLKKTTCEIIQKWTLCVLSYLDLTPIKRNNIIQFLLLVNVYEVKNDITNHISKYKELFLKNLR